MTKESCGAHLLGAIVVYQSQKLNKISKLGLPALDEQLA